MPRKAKIERSTSGIRDLLFDQIESMRNGDITPQELARTSTACSQILASARLELEVAKYMQDYDAAPPVPLNGKSQLKLGR